MLSLHLSTVVQSYSYPKASLGIKEDAIILDLLHREAVETDLSWSCFPLQMKKGASKIIQFGVLVQDGNTCEVRNVVMVRAMSLFIFLISI